MNKNYISTQSYKGARDFYPEDMRVRNYIFNTWKKVCRLYGFEEYDFPILEPLEIFAAKSGEEIVGNQMFTLQDGADRKLAIRPELTPGTVRMIAQRYKELTKPIKWFMIGNNWRYEKPQLGRGREFYQLEANIFGISSATADIEIFMLIVELMKTFGATQEMFKISINDRKLLKALLEDTLNLSEEQQVKVRRLMDKKSKMPNDEFRKALEEQGLSPEQVSKVVTFMEVDMENLTKVIDSKILSTNKGYQNLLEIFDLTEKTGISAFCEFDPSIIRGFDYSDGLVYEVFDQNPRNTRSLFGGERFDKLINIFGDMELEATGFAMGDIPLLEFLKTWDLLPIQDTETKYLVTLWPTDDSKYLQLSMKVAETLRSFGQNTEVWLEADTKLEKQIKYADKKSIPYVIILGEEELRNNTISIKDLVSGKQQTYDIVKWYAEEFGVVLRYKSNVK